MRKTYYSEFYPLATEEGVVGTTMPALTEARVTEIIGDIGIITDDSVLTADEKIRILIPLHDEVEITYDNVSAQATAFGINITQLNAARSAWISYLNSLSPAWDDETQNTDIDREVFRQKINEYLEHLSIIQANNNAEAARRADVDGGLTNGGTPINRSDVITREGTSNDTANVGGRPVTQVRNELDEALTKAREAVNAIDTVAPAVPTGLYLTNTTASVDTATGDVQNNILANWAAVTDSDLSFYQVEITKVGDTVPEIRIANSNSLSFPVLSSTLYNVRVRAVDKSGNRSAWSATVANWMSAKDQSAPNPPTAVGATAYFSSIAITASAPAAPDLASIQVYESATNVIGNATLIANMPAAPNTAWSFIRGGVPSGQTRYYWLRAMDTSGNLSGFSTSASATAKGIDESDLSNGLTPPIRGDYGVPNPLTANAPNLPSAGNYPGRVAINTNAAEAGKLYRYTTSGWSKALDGQDVQVGTLYGDRIVVGTLTGDRFAARSINVDKLVVASTDNLIPNGSFLGDANLSLPAGWSRFHKTGSDYIQVAQGDTTWPVLKMLKLHRVGNHSDELSVFADPISFADPSFYEKGQLLIQPGDEFYVESHVFSTHPNIARIEVLGKTQTGNIAGGESFTLTDHAFSSVNQNTVNINTAGFLKSVWTFRFNGTTPARIGLRFWNLGSSNDQFVMFGNILMRRRNGGTMQIDGTLKARHIEVASLTGDRFQAATIEGQHIAARTIRVNNLLVVGTNLNPDPAFEDDNFWVPEPNGWYKEGPDPGATGFYTRRYTLWGAHPTNAPGTARKRVFAGGDFVLRGLVPLSWYRLRARFWNTANQTVSVVIQYFDINNAYLGEFGVSSAAGTGQSVIESAPVKLPFNTYWYRYAIYNDTPGSTFTGACSVGEIELVQASDGKMVVDGSLEANHIKVRSLTGDRFQFNTLTGDLLAANTITARNLAIGNFDNIIPDGNYRDVDWWTNETSSGGTAWGDQVLDANGAWTQARYLVLKQGSGQRDFYSRWFPIEVGATYKVTFRFYLSDLNGNNQFTPYLHIPSFQWQSLRISGINGYATGGSGGHFNDASTYNGPQDTGEISYTFYNPPGVGNNANRLAQFRWILGSGSGNAFVQVKIVRVSDATLITDGGIITSKLAAGAVTAEKILVGSLSAVSANMGEVTAGMLRSNDSNTIFDLNNQRLTFKREGYELRQGLGLGTGVILWYGIAGVPPGSENRTNGVFALGTDGKVYYGTAEFSNGPGGAAEKVENIAAQLPNNTNWVTVASITFPNRAATGYWRGYFTASASRSETTSTSTVEARLIESGASSALAVSNRVPVSASDGTQSLEMDFLTPQPWAQTQPAGNITVLLQMRHAFAGSGGFTNLNGTLGVSYTPSV